MEITNEWLKSKNPCSDGYGWFLDSKKTDLCEILDSLLLENHFDWANWVIVRKMNKKQKVQYAIFAAEVALGVYEKEYPENDKPRKAIEASKAYLKNPCVKTKDAAYAADAAVDAAVDAANAAAAYAANPAAAYADVDAAYAASAAVYAAVYAAAAYADADGYAAAAYAANADANDGIQTKIIEYGKSILKLNLKEA